ncbi:MAG: hypothetical protein HQ582_14015 [Planctomycetes bacterium]|nr:hypothetical protein [Planctomycetota bacterium]
MRLRMTFVAVTVVAIALGSMQAVFAGETPKPKIRLVEPQAGSQAHAEAHAMVRVDETPASYCTPVYCAPFCCPPVYWAPVYCAPMGCYAPVSCYQPRHWRYPIRHHRVRMRGSYWGF